MLCSQWNSRRPCAFTLVEVLTVVVILGILAAIVIPQFASANTDAQLNALKANLQTIRAQIELYKMQHNESYPTSSASFVAQMTTASKSDGTTAAIGTSGFNFGPYLQAIPENPFTRTSTIGTGAYGTSAWYYAGSGTGQFRANDSAANAAY